MNGNNNTVKVDINVPVPEDLSSHSRVFLDVLGFIDKLYHSQLEGRVSGSITKSTENRAWSDIVGTLSNIRGSLPEHAAAEYTDSLRALKGGIYDLYPICIPSSERSGSGIELILGKVFLSSGGGEAYYSGTAGVLNKRYDGLIKAYDSSLPSLAASLGSLSESGDIEPPEAIPELKCLDVFSLAGGLKTAHKPICVFFSGGERENVSSLSNMTVFINLYENRFRALTLKASERYMPRAWEVLKDLSPGDVSRLLLIWLRGHDIGHFFGEDGLGREMSEFDMDYMILHELKSDFIALYNLRFLGGEVLEDLSLEQAYAAALSEMLRYIRRGGIYRHPDSGSAYLTALLLREAGAVRSDESSGVITYEPGLLELAVERTTRELIALFETGSVVDARAYVNRFGELADSDSSGFPESCPEELLGIIEDKEIPYSIDYEFNF